MTAALQLILSSLISIILLGLLLTLVGLNQQLMVEKIKQYAARKAILRKIFKCWLRDVKLKASVELKAHEKWK